MVWQKYFCQKEVIKRRHCSNLVLPGAVDLKQNGVRCKSRKLARAIFYPKAAPASDPRKSCIWLRHPNVAPSCILCFWNQPPPKRSPDPTLDPLLYNTRLADLLQAWGPTKSAKTCFNNTRVNLQRSSPKIAICLHADCPGIILRLLRSVVWKLKPLTLQRFVEARTRRR